LVFLASVTQYRSSTPTLPPYPVGPGFHDRTFRGQFCKELLTKLIFVLFQAFSNLHQGSCVQACGQAQTCQWYVLAGIFCAQVLLRFFDIDITDHFLQSDQRNPSHQEPDEFSEDIFYCTGENRGFLESILINGWHGALLFPAIIN